MGSNTPVVSISGNIFTLTFSNLERSDTGNYFVNVTNSEGSDTENFQLEVYCKQYYYNMQYNYYSC